MVVVRDLDAVRHELYMAVGLKLRLIGYVRLRFRPAETQPGQLLPDICV